MLTQYPNACLKELKKKSGQTLSYITNRRTALTSRNIRHTTGGQRSISVMSGNDRPVTRATFRESMNQSRLMIPGKFTYCNTTYRVFDCVQCQPIHSRHRVYLYQTMACHVLDTGTELPQFFLSPITIPPHSPERFRSSAVLVFTFEMLIL
jgi:hypothetical protein